MTRKTVPPAELPHLCTYTIGDPFHEDDPERRCGIVAVKKVDWTQYNEAWQNIWYCKRHWYIVKQYLQPGIIITDLEAGYGPVES